MEKHAKYDAICNAAVRHFAAAAFGTWGGIGPEGARLVSRMVKRAATWDEGEDRGLEQRRLYETLGVALYRQILHLLEAKNHVS